MATIQKPARKKRPTVKTKTGSHAAAAGANAGFPLIVPISTFAPEPFEIIKPFSVVVQPVEGSFVATLFDANIGASGETPEDAVQNLKDIVLNALVVLEEREHQLGREPKRQLAVLRSLISRRA